MSVICLNEVCWVVHHFEWKVFTDVSEKKSASLTVTQSKKSEMIGHEYLDTALLQNVGNYLPADTTCMSGDMKLNLTTLLHVTL